MDRSSKRPDTPRTAQYYERIVESLSSGVLALDNAGTIIMANPAAARHLGLSADALRPGCHYSELPLPEIFASVVTKALTGRTPVSRRELVLNPLTTSAKEIGLSVSPIQDEELLTGIVILFVDITERRALERAAELNRQLAQVGELAAGVVHEVRNPLSVIVGTAELLQRRLHDETHQRHIQTIITEARNIESGVTEFLGFARPFNLTPTGCHAEDIAKRACELSRARAEKKSVTLRFETPETIPEFRADPVRLAQALANVITNGIDAAADGGTVTVKVARQADDVVFEIHDTGPGIHTAPGENVFAPFFTKKTGGTGLGLAICHRIVTAHGGQVTFVSPPGGGTRFRIEIPASNTWNDEPM